jgi:hypothetical protein
MGTTKFTFDMLNKLEYDYLQDAITDYIKLYYDKTVLHVMLFEQIILNGEIILEQCKNMIGSNILPKEIQRKIEAVESSNKALLNENEKMKAFLKQYNVNITQIIYG